LQEIIQLQQKISYEINQTLVGKEEIILVEGLSKKSNDFLSGRTDSNKVVIIPIDKNIKTGDYIKVKITRATQATLFGNVVQYVESPQNNLALTA
jgi:tRNA-2-methylthio-N6-dimethylallyladenosine synthase